MYIMSYLKIIQAYVSFQLDKNINCALRNKTKLIANDGLLGVFIWNYVITQNINKQFK
jgi:hypothetical protein